MSTINLIETVNQKDCITPLVKRNRTYPVGVSLKKSYINHLQLPGRSVAPFILNTGPDTVAISQYNTSYHGYDPDSITIR